jgi:hypothetical protein
MDIRALLLASFAATIVCVGVARVRTLAIHAKVLQKGPVPTARAWNIGQEVLKEYSKLCPDGRLSRLRSAFVTGSVVSFLFFIALALYMAVASKGG